jgi:transposase
MPASARDGDVHTMRTDAIKLTQKQQALLRRRAIELRETGKSNADVALILSVHKKTVSGWWARYGQIGHALFEPGTRGRRTGAERRLTAEQERDVCRLITETSPDELGLQFVLWDGSAIGELIRRRSGILMPVRTLGEYLRRWGYTSKRPQKHARERGDRAMRSWLATTYPSILRGARHDAAQLFWGDQTGVEGQEPVATRSASQRPATTLLHTAAPVTLSMMRAFTNRGSVRFLAYPEALDAAFLILFCGRLIASTQGRAVCLVLDRRPVHHARAFRRWTNDHRHELTVHYLPAARR